MPINTAARNAEVIDDSVLSSIHALWDELADFDAARVEEARHHLMARICALIGAQTAAWVGAVRLGDPQPGDPVKGWRPRAIRHLHPDRLYEQKGAEQTELLEAGAVDITTLRNVQLSGQYRVNRLAELAPAEWFDGAYYRVYYLNAGRRDAIWAGIPVNEDAESYFGFYRDLDCQMFGMLERDIVTYALRGLRWFHRLQMLGEGLGVALTPLTPAERRILQGLLQGLSEKQIAAANEQSPHTTHDHVKRIFRKYGVTTRSGLMALWLGR